MKNGFTLAELIGVLVILSVLAAITYPIITDSYNKSKEGLSNEQKKSIESVARIWATKNPDELQEDKDRYVTIEELKQSGLIENKEIFNIDNQEELLTGCVKIYYADNKYNYKYDDYEECNQ